MGERRQPRPSLCEMSSIPPENLLLAVPKKGRLYDKCMKLLEGVGLEHKRPERLDFANCINMPITLVFLPAADIASYVGEGNVDMGITGLDVIAETVPDDEVEIIMRLGYGKCKLAVQAPVADNISNVAQLAGRRIVTSFPNLAKKFFARHETAATGETKIKFVSGSVEAACGLGLADAVVDLVETGTTMRAAGLEIVENVMETEAVLIANRKSTHLEILNTIKQRIQGFITATKYQMIQYNVARKDLERAVKVTPGKRSATVSSLEDGAFCAVSALVLKDESARIMDELQAVGADSILIIAISNSRM
mmetsp:Transcript_3137/g.6875  ORF Transcript_3137/g.6875 Transcript_3137/m.6875 type:complete len:308 (-) Transcript_3137:73-996(-)